MNGRSFRSWSLWSMCGLLATIGIVVGCREDVFVDPPESLIGRYTGIYTFVAVKNGIDTIKNRSQYITWQFKSTEYIMLWDSTVNTPIPPDTATDRQFCDNKGIYDLSSGITITVNSDGQNLRNSPCNTDENPDGFFGLDQSRKNPNPSLPDTIYILQVSVNPSNNAEESRFVRLVRDTTSF